jgi:predicted nucleotidyltransferase
MVQSQAIIDWCDRVAAEFKPARIIVFGSYAYGNATDDSDVDILVVVARGPDGCRKAAEISLRVEPSFPLDLLVRTWAVLEKRIALNDFFLQEIVTKGIAVYDAVDERVGQKGRKRLQQRGTSFSSVAEKGS